MAAIVAGSASAQISSSPAEELIRQQEREHQLRQRLERTPDIRLQEAKPAEVLRLPRGESPCFRIDRIALAGTDAEPFEWILPLADRTEEGEADPALNSCLGAKGIDLVMRRLQNAILGAGYLTTRILAEPQDLTGGVLRLTILAGRIRDIRFMPGPDGEVPGRATQWNALPVRPGDLLNLRDIEQALENFKRVPTVEADIQIAPAAGQDAQPGESDLLIAWRQGFPLRLSLSLDDSGGKATGRYQSALTVSYDHWWTLNDLFYISLNSSVPANAEARGTRGHTIHYSLPIGYALLAVTASRYAYRQTVAGLTAAVQYRGTSENADVKLARLVYRDGRRKTGLSLRGWLRSSANYVDDEEVQAQRRRMGGWEAAINHREFIGAATLEANLGYKRGTGAFGSLHAPEELRIGDRTGTARPRIVTADVQFNTSFQFAGRRLRYGGTWRAQWNRTPLVPQDRFSIGGRHTVRGFDGELVLSAERGWLVRNDLGWAFGDGGQELYFGIDHGAVAGPSASLLVGQRLTGAVLGLRGTAWDVNYDLFIGTPIARPENFETPKTTAGFSLVWSL